MTIPNILSLGPAFEVKVKATAESHCDIVISTGHAIKSWASDTNAFQNGVSVKSESPKFTSSVRKLSSKAAFVNAKRILNQSAISKSGVMNLTLEFNPSLIISLSVFGKSVFEGVFTV